MSNFPLLKKVFTDYEKVYRDILKSDPYRFRCNQAEYLLNQANSLPIVGIEKLASDSGGLHKFVNLLAEVRFSILFAKSGGSVEILRDRAFGKNEVYSPDLKVQFSGGLSIFVEVTRGSSGSSDITTVLSESIKQESLPFRVEYTLGDDLSIPPINGPGRAKNEKLRNGIVHQAIAGMRHAQENSWSEGVVNVFSHGDELRFDVSTVRLEDRLARTKVPTQNGEKWMGSFEFGPTPFQEGYAAGGVKSVHFIESEGHQTRFLRDVESKAMKRGRLPEAYLSTPFLVAIQNDENEMLPVDILSALTGSRCYFPDHTARDQQRWIQERDSKYGSVIDTAFNAGWGTLLTEWDYGSKPSSRITKYGAYMEDLWAKNLSGVIVLHQSCTTVQWLPNPFAAPEINNPRLQDIGLPLSKLGDKFELFHG